jgi:hypothetical protein
MVPMKALLYLLTLACAFGFAFWESKLKRELTSLAPSRNTAVSDLGILDDMAKKFEEDRFVAALPRAMKRRLRWIVTSKFAALLLLVLEVIFLQR